MRIRARKWVFVVLAVTCALLAASTAWFAHIIISTTDKTNALGGVNFALANQLLFGGLRRKCIDIFVPSNVSPACYEVGGYTVRVVPLMVDTDAEPWIATNFIEHNHATVLMFACRVLESDHDLAVVLLKLLSRARPDAKRLLDEIQEHGHLTEEGRRMVSNHEFQYDWRFRKYGQTPYLCRRVVVSP